MDEKNRKSDILSRRKFLSTAGLAVAGAAVVGCTTQATEAAEVAVVVPAATDAPAVAAATAEPCVCETPWLPAAWDYETDVLVLGFGAAGSAAAIEAADAGAKVMILEKMAAPGGACCESGGVVYAAGTTVQEEFDIKGDTADAMFAYLRAVGGGLDNEALTRIVADNSAGTIEWLRGLGAEFARVYISGAEKTYESVTPVVARGHTTSGRGAGLFEVLKAAVEERGVEVKLNARATGLVFTPTKEVLGVKAEMDGKTAYVRAAKAVVVATGGMVWNTTLLASYLPTIRNTWTIIPPGAEGDGLLLCQNVGANLKGIGIVGAATPGLASPKHPDRTAPFADVFVRFTASPKGPGIIVNKSAKRFTNETGFYGEWTKVQYAQVEAEGFCIIDEPGRVDETTVDAYTQYYYQSKGFENEIAAGIVKKAETIAEAAELVGLDPAALEETVNRWNENAAAGSDPDFGRTDWLTPISTPPFWIMETKPAITDCNCSVEIDTNAQVTDVTTTAIPRLFAAGTVTGGCTGETYGGSGTFISLGLTFGRIAGANAAALTTWS